MTFVFGILVAAAGVMLVIKTEWFLDNFGRITWFEDKFGTEGGSRLGYKLIGLLGIFVGVIMMVGLQGSFMAWLLSPVTNVVPK